MILKNIYGFIVKRFVLPFFLNKKPFLVSAHERDSNATNSTCTLYYINNNPIDTVNITILTHSRIQIQIIMIY